MKSVSDIRGYQDALFEWNNEHALVEREECQTKFMMVEGEVYTSPAFFNPVMVLNRDFSLLFAVLQSKKQERPLRIFEPLGGIGVRAFRLVNEIPEHVRSVVINDFGEVSSLLARYNRGLINSDKIIQFRREARSLASELAEEHYKFQMIDLDPFGPPTPFLDSLWNLTQNRGIISVTATDMQALAGVYPTASLRKYGGRSLNNFHTHETAARILIAAVVRSAARFDKGVRPVFTLSSHHYIKVFFEISEGRGRANEVVSQISNAGTCKVCQSHKYIEENESWNCCSDQVETYGPLWNGSIFDNQWCTDALEVLENYEFPSKRLMEKFLSEGTLPPIPFYYALEYIGSRIGTNNPRMRDLILYLEEKGYIAYKTRFRKGALRTNAPVSVIEEGMIQLTQK